GSAFSKIPKWFTCEVIVPFVITRLALLLVGWLGFRYFRFLSPFPLPGRSAPTATGTPSSITFLQLLIPGLICCRAGMRAGTSRLQGMGIAMSLAFPVALLFFHFTRCLSGLFTHCFFSLQTITGG